MLYVELTSQLFCKILEAKGISEASALVLYESLVDLSEELDDGIKLRAFELDIYAEYNLDEIEKDYGLFYEEETGQSPEGLTVDDWVSFLDDYTMALKVTDRLLVLVDF